MKLPLVKRRPKKLPEAERLFRIYRETHDEVLRLTRQNRRAA
jgi:hypothetical protein